MKTAQKRSMQELWQESWLSGGGDAWLEGLYESWLKDPSSLSEEWQDYFQTLSPAGDISHDSIREAFLRKPGQFQKVSLQSGERDHRALQQEKLADLITAYRSFGYLQADIDPLKLHQGPSHPSLALSWHGFSAADLTTVF